jgi:hypothetical protein
MQATWRNTTRITLHLPTQEQTSPHGMHRCQSKHIQQEHPPASVLELIDKGAVQERSRSSPSAVHEQYTSSARAVHEQYTSSTRAVHEQYTSSTPAVHQQCECEWNTERSHTHNELCASPTRSLRASSRPPTATSPASPTPQKVLCICLTAKVESAPRTALFAPAYASHYSTRKTGQFHHPNGAVAADAITVNRPAAGPFKTVCYKQSSAVYDQQGMSRSAT